MSITTSSYTNEKPDRASVNRLDSLRRVIIVQKKIKPLACGRRIYHSLTTTPPATVPSADGFWKTVKGGISASEGSTSQTFQIGRTASANPLDQNKVYDFRIVAIYSRLEVISSNILSLRIS